MTYYSNPPREQVLHRVQHKNPVSTEYLDCFVLYHQYYLDNFDTQLFAVVVVITMRVIVGKRYYHLHLMSGK